MEIDKMNVLDTIEKMLAAGKVLPQRDRIRFAKDPAEEQRKVLDQTANLFWDIFSKQHIGIMMWEKATDRALILNSIPKLETSIINPALMSVALAQCEKEYLEAQQVKYEQQKKEERSQTNAYPFPEMGKLIAYHMQHHLKPFIELPSSEVVTAWAKHGGWSDETIEKNLIKLKIYYVFGKHAKRDNTKMPVKLVLNDDRSASIQFVD